MNDSEETKTTREALVHDVHLRLTEDDMHLVRGVAEALGRARQPDRCGVLDLSGRSGGDRDRQVARARSRHLGSAR